MKKNHRFKRVISLVKKDLLFLSLLGLLILGSLGGLLNSNNLAYSFKQTLVLVSVLVITLLIRYWFQFSREHKEIVSSSFIFSSIPVSLWALYQNIAHELGGVSFEIMPARPNATFWEPDWLGFYLVLVLILLLIRISSKRINPQKIMVWGILILLNQGVLIITVARASWVALIGVWLTYGAWILLAYLFKRINKKSFIFYGGKLFLFLGLGVIALSLVEVFHLTRFNLQDRLASIYKGEHLITVAQKEDPPLKIKIDLEEIDYYKQQGFSIIEEKVSDENIDSRMTAYASNWEMVKRFPFLGQGQGSIMLERNKEHNANNIFWEWWVATGILGLGAFLTLLIVPLFKASQYLLIKPKKHRPSFLNLAGSLLGVVAIVILNLFNSGIFFVPLWIFIGFRVFPIRFK